MPVIYQWIFAHLLGDFVLQSKKMVQHKKRLKQRSWILYAHCLLHGGLIYLFSPDKSLWLIPVIVAISHFIIDLWKLYRKDSALVFVTDQLLHISVLFVLWFVYYQPGNWWQHKWLQLIADKNIWIIAAGYIFIIFPLAQIVGFATQKWRHEVEIHTPHSAISLSEAGRWIGIFERILVYTFVVTNHFEGIGFLIAAKSILRFTDIKGNDMHKEAEYVLIGTLMSFSASIITGISVNILMQ